MRSIRYFVDAWSLFAENEKYTGIQNVNYQIVKYFYENLKDRVVFFNQTNALHEMAIQSMLRNRYRSRRQLATVIARNVVTKHTNLSQE